MIAGRRWLQCTLGVTALILGCGMAAGLSAGAGAQSTRAVTAAAVKDHNLPSGTARQLTSLGLAVDWPVAVGDKTARPGTHLAVAIGALNSKGLTVTGTVTLTERSGTHSSTLASVPLGDVSGTSLDAWRLDLLVPRARGVHYLLALTAGKVRYSSQLVATGSEASAPVTTGAGEAAKVTLSPDRSVPNQPVSFTVTNTGSRTLAIDRLAWQHEASNGVWSQYSYGATCCPGRACPQYIVLAVHFWSVTLGPGDSVANATTVPPSSASGNFRLAPATSTASSLALTSEATAVTAPNTCGTTMSVPAPTTTGATTTTRTPTVPTTTVRARTGSAAAGPDAEHNPGN